MKINEPQQTAMIKTEHKQAINDTSEVLDYKERSISTPTRNELTDTSNLT